VKGYQLRGRRVITAVEASNWAVDEQTASVHLVAGQNDDFSMIPQMLSIIIIIIIILKILYSI
jgi:hypothetical protein